MNRSWSRRVGFIPNPSTFPGYLAPLSTDSGGTAPRSPNARSYSVVRRGTTWQPISLNTVASKVYVPVEWSSAMSPIRKFKRRLRKEGSLSRVFSSEQYIFVVVYISSETM